MEDTIVEMVREDLLARAQTGFVKYGVTLARTDLTREEWLQHAYEEALDLANYLKRLIVLEKDLNEPQMSKPCVWTRDEVNPD
jgi:hypothetical protein